MLHGSYTHRIFDIHKIDVNEEVDGGLGGNPRGGSVSSSLVV